jgi:hypothetical protein
MVIAGDRKNGNSTTGAHPVRKGIIDPIISLLGADLKIDTSSRPRLCSPTADGSAVVRYNKAQPQA